MSLDLTVTDLFCGAGGSSIGAESAGAQLRMAANHWPMAIETHAQNFPHADHDCADISQVEPRRYPSTDILLASPECTHHSLARSKRHQPNLFDPEGDPAAERSRATMWDIPRFAEVHDYQTVVVENVVEVTKWPPFQAWLAAMDSYGYEHHVLSLNSMVAPGAGDVGRAPQSRDRVYIVFWKRGNSAPDLELRPPSFCPSCDTVVEARQVFKRHDRFVGKYRQQYVYRCPTCNEVAWPLVSPAAAAIDWTLDCPRIGDRAKPLAEATMRRIATGLDRFGVAVVQKSGHTYERPGSGYVRAWPVDGPLPTQTTETHHALVMPLVVPLHHGATGPGARPTLLPWPTQTGRQDHALVVPLRRNGRVTDASTDTMPTVTAGGNHHGLLMIKQFGDGRDPAMAHPLTSPFGTVTTIDHHALVAVPFLTSYYGTGGHSDVIEPVPTVTTRDRHALVDPGMAVDDCGFRMLEPHEIGAAMAFPASYEVTGNKRERVKQYGNAVTPPAMGWITGRCIAALGDAA